MTRSDNRRAKLIEEHWADEAEDWKAFRTNTHAKWDALYPNFDIRRYILAVEYVRGPEGHEFVKELFDPNQRGDFDPTQKVLGSASGWTSTGLVFRARNRIRARYHSSMTFESITDATAQPMMRWWPLVLTPEALLGGLKVASGMEYAVTLSTPAAGASARNFHFLAMPRRLLFEQDTYVLYDGLARRSLRPLLDAPELSVSLVNYPAFCVRIDGANQLVADATWSLAKHYADLIAYNLVILPRDDVDHSTLFFFPRPIRPVWEGPDQYDWSFGAFEMGGFYVQGDRAIYDAITYDNLCAFLREVTIWPLVEEQKRMMHLLSRLCADIDVTRVIQGYVESRGAED